MKRRIIAVLTLLSLFIAFAPKAQHNNPTAINEEVKTQELDIKEASERPIAKKILFIGDSMTGWLAERLEAYGKENGFEVSTVVWDGSTIKKWGSNPKLKSIVKEMNPDAIFVSLGLNDLFETNPDVRCKNSLESIKEAAGDAQLIWVGPPSWPGKKMGEVMVRWLGEQLGEGHYFDSFNLSIPRQSRTNPHPTRAGASNWIDNVVSWIETDGAIALPGYEKPTGVQMARGKNYIYKRMKENL